MEPLGVKPQRYDMGGAARQTEVLDMQNLEQGATVAARSVWGVNGAFSEPIVRYLAAVCSLIERRKVQRIEVLSMLHAMQRQHRMAKERRVDYIIREMNKSPP